MPDPKLLKARDQIRAILDDFDIAGHIVLHNNGNLEVLTKLDPSYSNISGVPPMVRLRSKLEDYGGDSEAQMNDLRATANMVRGFAEVLGLNARAMFDLSEAIDAKTGAEHTPLKPDDEPPHH